MAPAVESSVLHEYRHLLRTASTDWQETAHRHALWSLGPQVRAEALTGMQRLLLAGTRLRPDDVHAVARFIVLAERRRPRILLDGLPAPLVEQLAVAVVGSPTGKMLMAGIDVWDGAEPPARRQEPPSPTTTSAGTGIGAHLPTPDWGGGCRRRDAVASDPPRLPSPPAPWRPVRSRPHGIP